MKDSSTNLRLATLEDAIALTSLTAELGYPSSVVEMAARLTALLARANHAVWVIAQASHVIGWLHVCEVLTLEGAPFGEIRGLVVAEGRRGMGVGTALVQAAEQWAADRGYGKVRVRSNSMRVEARRFYEKLGFEVRKNQIVFDKVL